MHENSFVCLTKKRFDFNEHSLVPIRYEDIFLIKDWRNKQVSILRQQELLTDSQQEAYYQRCILPQFFSSTPNFILFSYLHESRCIGYGGLVHIDWLSKRAEVSFLLDPGFTSDDKVYTQKFSIFLSLIKEVSFNVLSFNKIFTETYDIRSVHIQVLEKSSFRIEGRLRQHVFIEQKYVDSLMHGYLKEDYYG